MNFAGGGEMVTGATVEFRGHGGQARAGADSWSKIIFQHHARTEPLQIDELVVEAAVGAAVSTHAVLTRAKLRSRLIGQNRPIFRPVLELFFTE